jgi:phosphate starvation-inducible protein PhoH and related proteins
MGKKNKRNGNGSDIQCVLKKEDTNKVRSHTVCTKIIKPKTVNQNEYVKAMGMYDIIFGIGPSGTGKTLLSVYYAIQQVFLSKVNKIVISRPVVEAGETLGFLPGDLEAKIDPYIRPIMDALREILGTDKKVVEWTYDHVEIAPLAFMRGRTFTNCILILDEAQNTTEEQLFMFLTRMGAGSKIIITADPTQIDLKRKKDSGIFEALAALRNVKEVGIIQLTHEDVLRCPVVSHIVNAYARHRNNKYREEKIVQEVFGNE